MSFLHLLPRNLQFHCAFVVCIKPYCCLLNHEFSASFVPVCMRPMVALLPGNLQFHCALQAPHASVRRVQGLLSCIVESSMNILHFFCQTAFAALLWTIRQRVIGNKSIVCREWKPIIKAKVTLCRSYVYAVNPLRDCRCNSSRQAAILVRLTSPSCLCKATTRTIKLYC